MERYYAPTPEAMEVVDRFDLSQDQILAALHISESLFHGGKWQPILVDDLGQEVGDHAFETAKKAGWYALEDEHWGRQIWQITEKGREVLAPFAVIVATKPN